MLLPLQILFLILLPLHLITVLLVLGLLVCVFVFDGANAVVVSIILYMQR